MAIAVNSVTNANIYVNGASFLGRAKEVSVPEVAYKMVDHEALGMVGVTELFAGIDKMEATIMWNSFYADAIKALGDPNASINMIVRASMRTRTSAGLTGEVPVKMFLTCQAKSLPGANFKQNENVELESKLNVSACRLEIENDVVFEVDILANIFKVGGVDILAKYRQNIGA